MVCYTHNLEINIRYWRLAVGKQFLSLRIGANLGVEKYLRTLAEKLVLVVLVLLTACGISAQETVAPGELLLQPMAFGPTGIYDLKALDNSLNGEGVKYAVICRSFNYIGDIPQNDYRPAVNHNSLSSGQFLFYDDNTLPDGVSPHATSLCSILFGEDQYAYHPIVGRFYYQGAVPKAQAEIYEFQHFVKNNLSLNIPPDADIITLSLGDQFDRWWTRGIESFAERYGIVVVAGIGNGTQSNNDPVLYPGAGSNAIGVGVINSLNTDDLLIQLATFALAYPENSSTGPTIDERCKPDIVAPGNCLAADISEPNKYEPTGNFSSFSTPLVAGAAGLLIQKAKQDTTLNMAVSAESGNCVIKAILLTSATKLPFWHKGRLTTKDDHYRPLDYIQGAGMLNTLGAYDILTAGRKKQGESAVTGWDIDQLNGTTITSKIYRTRIDNPADKYITATLCWNRHYEQMAPFNALPEKNSDLRLEVWAVDSNNPDNRYLLDYSDSKIDNVEHIYVKADPNFTDYEIVLSMNKDDFENTQSYGFAWSVTSDQNKESSFWYDLNGDGSIDKKDFDIMFNNFKNSQKSSDEYLLGDINLDGEIKIDDLSALLDNIDKNKLDNNQITDSTNENDDLNLVFNAD